MNIDTTFSTPHASYALVQTLGFTGAERSNGSQITVGGVSVATPVAIGSTPGYWNNLLAAEVANALSESAAYKNLVIDVKENTVILIQPFSDSNFSPISVSNGSNSTIGMTLNAPSGWVDGVWFGENPWSNFLAGTTSTPALVEVNVYTFGFTGGERSNGSLVTVGGATFTTPIANSPSPEVWNKELARLHVLALDSKEQYGTLAADGILNTSILVAPRTFNNPDLATFAGQSSTIGVSLDFPSGWNNEVWLGENPWSNYFASYTFERSNDIDEGGSGVFTLLTKNIPTNTSISYVLSGIAAADLVGGNLTGNAVVNSTGKATITVPVSADSLTEGIETLVVTANGATTSIKINDTSLKPVAINSSINTPANEKFAATAEQKSTTVLLNFNQGTLTKDPATGDWLLTSSQLGTDTFTGFNRLVFNDKTVALDFAKGQSGYNAAMIIGAAFGKEFVNQYFAIGVSLFDNKKSMSSICDLVVQSGLVEAAVGNSNSAWVNEIYENVVGVKPDQLTSFVFTNYLETGIYTKSSLLELAVGVKALESQVGLVGLETNGLEYTPFI